MADETRTKVFGALALAVLAVGLWWWLGHANDGTNPGTDTASSSTPASEPDRPAPHPKTIRRSDVDPWQAPRAVVTGTVRDHQGQPIADAQVCARLDDDDLAQTERHPPHCVTTRKDGTYRIADLLGAEHRLFASARGYLPRGYRSRRGIQNRLSSSLDLAAGVTRDAVDFVLTPGGVELTGVIKDIAGGVVEDAWVSSQTRGWGTDSATFTLSDPEGRFSLWVRGPTADVSAYAEGYARASRSVAVPGTFTEVFLTPESVVVGTVVWAQTGKPVGGAKVSTDQKGQGSVYSESDGSFRLEGLEPGAYKITVSGEEWVGLADHKVHVGLGQTSEPVVVKVHPAFSVRGTVRVDDGPPCSYGSVTLVNEANATKGSYRGGDEDDGSVLVEGLLPGTYNVVVACNDYVPQPEYPDLVIVDASLTDLTWTVHAGQSIRGRVVDASGDPVEGARVSAWPKATEDPGAQRTINWGDFSEPDGSFSLLGLLPGDYDLSVRHRERPTPDKPTQVELPAGKNLDDVTLTLPEHGNVEGTVVDEKGDAVANVLVRLSGPRWGSSTQTNDEGHFVVQYVEAGSYRISAQRSWFEMRAPGASDDDAAGERIEIEAGETTEVELVVEAQSGRITGQVLGEGGEPIADAFIDAVRESDSAAASGSQGDNREHARWGSWSQQPLLTDEEGRFTLTDLTEGATYSVYASRKGGGEALAEHVPEGTDVALSIRQVGVLSGVVRVKGGGSPQRFSIAASDAASGLDQRDRFLETDGRWELSNLEPGTYQITADAAEGNATLEVELAEGETKTDLELVLAPRVTVTGTLVDAESGAPVPGLMVVVTVGSDEDGLSLDGKGKDETSNAEGRFRVPNAPTGKVQLMILPADFSDNVYGWTWVAHRLTDTPSVQDVGNVELVKRRVEPGEEAGDLGFEVKKNEPDTEAEDVRMLVAVVRPGGPAAAAGLKVGEEIVTVDGQEVRGVQSYRYFNLTNVLPETTIQLGVMSGEELRSVAVTAGPPR